MEFAFFHQFFNPALQDRLKRVRRALYGRSDPPMVMKLQDAEETFGLSTGVSLEAVRKHNQQGDRMRQAALGWIRRSLGRSDVHLDTSAIEQLAEELLAISEADKRARECLERMSSTTRMLEALQAESLRFNDELKLARTMSTRYPTWGRVVNAAIRDVLARP